MDISYICKNICASTFPEIQTCISAAIQKQEKQPKDLPSKFKNIIMLNTKNSSTFVGRKFVYFCKMSNLMAFYLEKSSTDWHFVFR